MSKLLSRWVAILTLIVIGAVLYAAPILPVVAWRCALPQGVRVGDTLFYDSESFSGIGSDPSLTTLHFLPSQINPAFASRCLLRWANGPDGRGAISLNSASADAENGGVLQCGDGAGVLKSGNKLTLYANFKMNAPMSYGGGSPGWELDGSLISLTPNVTLTITGRGGNGKSKRLPQLRISDVFPNSTTRYDSVYTPQMPDELKFGQWYQVIVTWDGEQTADNNGQAGVSTDTKHVRMWVKGQEYPIKRIGHANASPAMANVQGPILVGGNRSWGNVSCDLAGFAIYNSVLPDTQIQQLATQGVADSPAKPTTAALKDYETLTALNAPEAWTADTQLSVTSTGNMLQVTCNGMARNERRNLYLKQPIPLDTRVRSVNYWFCHPPGNDDCGFSLMPLFADKNGKEIPGDAVGMLAGHLSAPNERGAGLWRYVFTDIPRKLGATQFVGFSLTVSYLRGNLEKTPIRSFFLNDLGLERIDYSQARLYYVVGNYRDNFKNTGFNNAGARALTELSSASDQPYLLLDNLVDQAKGGRPARINVRLFVYNMIDRLVYSTTINGLAAQTTQDFFCKIPIPITNPGTYCIKGKSYDAETGAYYTTDWVKLIIIKGAAQTLQPKQDDGLLAINPDKPFGRLEKADKHEIALKVGANADAAHPIELRYTVIPNDAWIPGGRAIRPVTCDQKVAVTKPGVVTVPYTPQHAVEMVVAELWQGTTLLDHEERLIGIRNDLDKAPAFTNAAQIPSLDDLAGPGKNWLNVQLHTNPGDDLAQVLARNIDEAKKLAPNLGFSLDVNRLEPIPGVFDWDYLTPLFDTAAQHGCRIVLYLNLKWPLDWAPIEFQQDSEGCVHHGGVMWGYMVGKYLYPNGEYAPSIIKQFNQQLARKYLNHPGLGGYYFENEHIDSYEGPLNSYHEATRRGYAQYLTSKYTTIAKLNAAYGTHYTTFTTVPLPDENAFSSEIALADYRLYKDISAQKFLLDDEFDAVRHEDPKRPIIVYHTIENNATLQHIAQNGGMLANGGIHSNFNMDAEYEHFNAVPGLRFRMEPHDMYNYDPIKNGFDEMLFGMLAMGGRGLQFHVFLPGVAAFNYDKAMQPGQRTGYDKLVRYAPMLQELRDTEKLHDPIGVLQLYSKSRYFGESFEWGVWPFSCGLYALSHYNPKTVSDGGQLSYLNGSKLLYIGGSVISAEQLAYVSNFVKNGGKLLMEMNAGQYSLEQTGQVKSHCLLDALGVDLFTPGRQLPGMKYDHDLYSVGQGEVLIIRRPLWNNHWAAIMPAIMEWAGIRERLCDSDDPYMQMHVLRHDADYYLVTTHRAHQQSGYDGPEQWNGKIRFTVALPAGNYRVSELMNNQTLGTFTPAQLAAGIDAGDYSDLQMKIFKIAPEK